MHVVFVVHDMHTNLTEVRDALIKYGHKCTFISEYVGPSEPEICDDRVLKRAAEVSRHSAKTLLSRLEPDLLIQRNFNGGYVEFWREAERERIPRLRYDQDPSQFPFPDCAIRPLRVVRFILNILYFRIKLGPHRRITPVKYWGKENRLNFPNAEHLPFPAVIRGSVRPGSSRPLRVLAVGKHGQRRKRMRWLVRALQQSSTAFTLIIVGSSPSPTDWCKQKYHNQFLQLIDSLGERAKNVVVHENLDRDAMAAIYESSDIFVLPSKRELMAISPLEAMSHGLPVLASSDGGATSYIHPVGSDQVFRARSYRDFRKKLFRLLVDENLRNKLSERALRHLKHAHSPKGFVDRLSELANAEISK